MKGRIMSWLGTAAVGYLLVLLALFLLQRSLLYLPSQNLPAVEHAGIPGLQAFNTEPQEGLSLTHWFHPPAEPDGAVTVLFHGNAGHLGDRAGKLRPLLLAGIGVVFTGYRGYGGNPGSPTEEGLSADARSVLAWLQDQGIAPARTVLMGESLGSAVAVKMAAEHDVAAVVLEAPPSSIAEVAQAHYWYVPAKWLIHDRWDSLSRVADIAAPLFLLHGERDATVPVRFGRRLYEAAQEPKEALFLPRASHNNLFDFPEVPQKVIEFIKRHAGG